MKHLIIAAVSLTSVTTPVMADRHCRAPEAPLPYLDVAKYDHDLDNHRQALGLTFSDFLYEYHSRNLEICHSKGANYNFDCDSPEYGEMGEVDPDYLGLSEEEYLEIEDANRLRTMELRDAFAACIGDS